MYVTYAVLASSEPPDPSTSWVGVVLLIEILFGLAVLLGGILFLVWVMKNRNQKKFIEIKREFYIIQHGPTIREMCGLLNTGLKIDFQASPEGDCRTDSASVRNFMVRPKYVGHVVKTIESAAIAETTEDASELALDAKSSMPILLEEWYQKTKPVGPVILMFWRKDRDVYACLYAPDNPAPHRGAIQFLATLRE